MSDTKTATTDTKKTTPFWRRLLNVIGYTLFAFYLFLTASGVYVWVKTLYFQSKDFSHFVANIDEYRALGQVEKALEYIKAQPQTKQKEITEILIHNAPKYEPIFYYEISKRLFQKYVYLESQSDPVSDKMSEDYLKQAIFWSMLGRFRVHIDARRCGPGPASEAFADNYSNLLTPGRLAYFSSFPFSQIAPVLEQVLIWDKKYPPQARPDYLCNLIYARQGGQMKVKTDPESWDRVRENYRLSTIHNLSVYYQEAGISASSELPELMQLTPPEKEEIKAPISEDEAKAALEEATTEKKQDQDKAP